jgi:VanZ family protein
MTLRRLIAYLSASPWLLPVAVLAMIAIAVLALVPGQWQWRTGLPPQLEHFVAYFGLGLVLGVAWPPTRRVILSIGLLLIAFAGVLEILQHWAPGRDARLIDALISVGGAITGLAIAAWLRRQS